MGKLYMCIDLKSFYASVECVRRGLDPFKVSLVVADPSRGNGALCLAISPYMKTLGVHNRCRLFEIPKGIDYVVAVPKMKDYIRVSGEIYNVYLKFFAPEDIYVYSIDECFMDVTSYLNLYKTDPFSLAKRITDAVFQETGICATVGIGTNMFLCKIAMDILAKHEPSHIGYLDEEKFKEKMWDHTPITDFWNISYGIERRLKKYGVSTLRGVTELPQEVLYREFGINAEYLIDHAWGKESCTIEQIKAYVPKGNSLSNSQILFEDYSFKDAEIVMKEMIEINVLELVDKGLVTNGIGLMIGYSKDVIPMTGGTRKLDGYTQSYEKLKKYMMDLFYQTTSREYPIRRIGISFGGVIPEEFENFDLFDDVEKLEKERNLQRTINELKHMYGKNSLVKCMDLQEKATTMKRNKLVGGHNGE